MKRNRGVTLIEVLIAVLVLGIGLVGVAGLQGRALQMNAGSYQRTQATMLAQALADRMRANPVAVQQEFYDMGSGVTASATASCTTSSGCGTQAMARNDLAAWTTNVGDTLPEGTGIVCIDSTPDDGTPSSIACDGGGDNRTIKVWWTDRMVDGNETRRFVTEFRP